MTKRVSVARLSGRLGLHLFLILMGFTFALPFFWVASTSLKLPGRVFTYPIEWIPRYPEWSNYRDIFTFVKAGGTEASGGQSALLLWLRNTLYLTTMGTLGTLISSVVVAYSLSRLQWRGRDFVFSLTLISMMLPGVVTLIPTFLIFRDLKWINTYLPLIVPYWTGGGAFYIFMLRQFFATLPLELDEAAIVDGAGTFRILWQILLPLAKPGLASVGIFSFLFHYNEFMGPLIYINSLDKYPISVGLRYVAGRYGDRWPQVMVMVMFSLVPVVILFFFTQKTFVQGIQTTGIAGR